MLLIFSLIIICYFLGALFSDEDDQLKELREIRKLLEESKKR
jgi:hypothetical protein